jgi:hypothetical protein
MHLGDIEGKLDVLRVECTKCPRKGRYSVHNLIEKYGRMGNMIKWKEQLNGDCLKRDGRMYDRCDLICPDMPKAIQTKNPAVRRQAEEDWEQKRWR